MIDKGIVTKDWSHCFNPACRRFVDKHIRPYETHHCLHGSMREAADDHGLIVPLCTKCHKELHDNNSQLDKFIQRAGEKAFIEKYYPNDSQEGIKAFRQIFGKNYLYDTREGQFDAPTIRREI